MHKVSMDKVQFAKMLGLTLAFETTFGRDDYSPKEEDEFRFEVNNQEFLIYSYTSEDAWIQASDRVIESISYLVRV